MNGETNLDIDAIKFIKIFILCKFLKQKKLVLAQNLDKVLKE